MTAPPGGHPHPTWVPPHWQPPLVSGPVGRRSLVPLIAGAAIFVVAAVVGATGFSGVFSSPVLSGAGTVSEHARAGTYYVYAQTGTSHSAGPLTFSSSGPADIDPQATHVSLDGRPLAITPYQHDYSSTLTRGSRTFSAVAQVDVPHSGTIAVTADHDEGAITVAPTIGATVKKLIVPAAVAAMGLALGVAGVVWRARAGGRRKPRWVQGHWA